MAVRLENTEKSINISASYVFFSLYLHECYSVATSSDIQMGEKWFFLVRSVLDESYSNRFIAALTKLLTF